MPTNKNITGKTIDEFTCKIDIAAGGLLLKIQEVRIVLNEIIEFRIFDLHKIHIHIGKSFKKSFGVL